MFDPDLKVPGPVQFKIVDIIRESLHESSLKILLKCHGLTENRSATVFRDNPVSRNIYTP